MANDFLKLSGMVLSSAPAGEYDRRLVLLTRERGKISAFARGSRKPNSPLLAISTPFVFGDFYFFEGRNSYTLKSAEVLNYFEGLKQDLELVCFASYFAEFASYYSRENLSDPSVLNLLYKAYQALLKKTMDRRLIKSVFELKLMQINGEYSISPKIPVGEGANYTWQYVLSTNIAKLFQFTLKPPALEEFIQSVTYLRCHMVDGEFHSLEILEELK